MTTKEAVQKLSKNQRAARNTIINRHIRSNLRLSGTELSKGINMLLAAQKLPPTCASNCFNKKRALLIEVVHATGDVPHAHSDAAKAAMKVGTRSVQHVTISKEMVEVMVNNDINQFGVRDRSGNWLVVRLEA